MKNKMIFSTAALLAMLAGGAGKALAVDNHGNTTTTPGSGAIGNITQLNYGADGSINGFLVGTPPILLTFRNSVWGGIGTLGAVGNAVTYSGRDTTNTTTLFQTVSVSSFTNNT